MSIDANEMTMRYWDRTFRRAIIAREYDFAEFAFERLQSWRRRTKLGRMLGEICEAKNFGTLKESRYGQ